MISSQASSQIPLSLYVHIPWCVRKCPYCDFNSHQQDKGFDEARYVDALLADLAQEANAITHRPLRSVFFGGGTPSLFSAGAITRVLRAAQEHLGFSDEIEVTLEANPGTFEQDRFSAYLEAGVNRLSIGIQSFNDAQLQALGRIHSADEAQRAIATARRAGFDNINLDLMFGLPGQDLALATRDIDIAIDAGVTHLSHYQLTIEPNTYFHRYPPSQPDMDSLWEMQQACQQQLASNGYEQYEVSAYARPGRRSAHNLNYWLFGDYIGIGAGAHGKLSTQAGAASGPEPGDALAITRRRKHRQPAMYMTEALQGNALSGSEQISNEQRSFEFLLNALRLKQGCASTLFTTRTALTMTQLRQQLGEIDDELLIINEQQIGTTERGYLFLNEILEKLV